MSEDPSAILGVPPEAGPEEIRAAYLRKVKEHPPDRSSIEFERIRDAYESLADPRRRARLLLVAEDLRVPLASLVNGQALPRRFVGDGPWRAVWTEK